MTEVRPVPPASVPTLTEVVDAPGGAMASTAAPAVAPPASPLQAATPGRPTATAPELVRASLAAPPSETELVERILNDLQHQVDLVVEYRIRERLTPILERAGDTLVREARAELARSLRDIVARAVASELRRQRGA